MCRYTELNFKGFMEKDWKLSINNSIHMHNWAWINCNINQHCKDQHCTWKMWQNFKSCAVQLTGDTPLTTLAVQIPLRATCPVCLSFLLIYSAVIRYVFGESVRRWEFGAAIENGAAYHSITQHNTLVLSDLWQRADVRCARYREPMKSVRDRPARVWWIAQ